MNQIGGLGPKPAFPSQCFQLILGTLESSPKPFAFTEKYGKTIGNVTAGSSFLVVEWEHSFFFGQKSWGNVMSFYWSN